MSKITLQGILYDEKSSFLKGSALAPPLIRKAYHSDSANYYAESGMEIRADVFDDKGDFKILQYNDIEEVTNSNLNKRIPLLSLGGDHSITFPIVKSIYKIYGAVDLLHIDAHGDLYNHFEGDKYSHACPFARIMEAGLASKLTQIGIRTLNAHQREQAARFDVEIIEMKDFHRTKLPEFNNPIYLSLDMDALDPAFAPGVSHHEPGGLSTREILTIIQNLSVPLVGADIVEYNPTRDVNDMTAMVCAKLFREISSKMLENNF